MPPQLALLLCSGFVLALLVIERRESPDVSLSTWIPTLWMLVVSSKPMAYWLGMAGSDESGNAIDRAVLLTLAAAAFVIVLARRPGSPRTLRAQGALLALLGYMLVSTLWSDLGTTALKRWVRESIVIVMAVAVASESDPRRALESILRRSAYVLIPFSLLLIKYYPSLGREYGRWSGGQMWVGVTVHKNTLGRLCLICAFFLLWALYRRWRSRAVAPATRGYGFAADVLVLLLTLYLLNGSEDSYSATSVGTLALGVMTALSLLWIRRLKRFVPRPALLLLVALLIAFGASGPWVGGANISTFSSLFGRSETLTGRTDTWAELMPAVNQSPVLGYGLESFWTPQRRDFYRMSHGHNGYLDIVLNLGAVGLTFYVFWLMSCAATFYRRLTDDYAWASFGISFLVMALVYNSTESGLTNLTGQMSALLVLITAAVAAPLTRRGNIRSASSSAVQAPSSWKTGGPSSPRMPRSDSREVRDSNIPRPDWHVKSAESRLVSARRR